jgi:epoxyqueuosine reductase
MIRANEKNSRDRWELFARFFVAVSWAGFIFAMIGQPMPPSNGSGISILDKLVHIFIFGVLSFLIFRVRQLEKNHGDIYQGATTFIITTVYAYICELYQTFVPGRTASDYDLMAGMIGAALGIILAIRMFKNKKPKILLHICCAGCGAYVGKFLQKEYDVYFLFSNSNIYPQEEYAKRLEEVDKVAKFLGIAKKKIIIGDYEHELWQAKIKGFEKEKERGKRCEICYRMRLEQSIKTAKKMNIGIFTSTLTISPHKDAKLINLIGSELASESGIKFIEADFKKNEGFKQSTELNRQLGLYRQNYCGCEYSKR